MLRTAMITALIAIATSGIATVYATTHSDERNTASIRLQIVKMRQQTWECQKNLGIVKSPTHYYERNTQSVAYLDWLRVEWKSRRDRCRERLASWEYLERDFHHSLRWVAAKFDVNYSWLHTCDHSEGSDRMVWNGGIVDPNLSYYPRPSGSSGAYGPMQFMEGTFSGFSRHGWDALKARGIKVPQGYRRWNSNLGQAIAAAWGFRNGLSYHWVGRGC